jgi:predicted flap endonuclease-1-like 5' DNA nuclease
MNAITLLEEGGANGEISWLVWIVLIVFLLMVFLGWLASSKGWLKSEAEPEPDSHGHKEIAQAVKGPSVLDDLSKLEGIGPKVVQVLSGINISTFEDLAKADYDKVKTALDAAGYKYMDPAGWIEQAALASKGDIEGLQKLQEALKGGRKTA